jgi:hypothetical protein
MYCSNLKMLQTVKTSRQHKLEIRNPSSMINPSHNNAAVKMYNSRSEAMKHEIGNGKALNVYR